nr:hypothetical protein [uncultured Pseudoxanthomonas sp.]
MKSSTPPLARTFYTLPEQDSGLDNHAEWLAYGLGRKLGWNDLLQSSRILIVSEAGMGKTYECQQQQRELWDKGEPAFFIELMSLVNGDLRTALSDDVVYARFEAWREAQTEIATFFLDSIDEHALTHRRFDQTLKQFSQYLRGRLDRVRIVLTTRPVPVDLESVQRYLPVVKVEPVVDPQTLFADVAMGVQKGKSDKKEWQTVRHVALAPLEEPQMRALAKINGISDASPLLDAINRQHAHDYAKRPLDFIALCGDWKIHGTLRTHRDQVESDVTRKLKPRSASDRQDRTNLSTSKAREGAERLALAALLTRRFTFWHSQDVDLSRGDDALDPALVLEGLTHEEVWALLERPLFGLATYGRVRFHNRSVIEYLSSCLLLNLYRAGLPMSTLKRLLFVETPVGTKIVKPSMRPVAAWLASDVHEIFEELLRREPDVLLRHGDPAQLPLSARARAVRCHVETHGAGNWRGQTLTALQIQRFSTADLAPTIKELWSKGVQNPEVRETLLHAIGAGGMLECADIAHQAAWDINAPASERLNGLTALADLQDPRLADALAEMSVDTPQWPQALVEGAIVRLFPIYMTVPLLLGALKRLQFKKRRYVGALSVLPRICEREALRPDQLTELRQGVFALIEHSCQWDAPDHRLKAGRADLITTLLVLCRLEIQQCSAAASLADAISLAFHVASEEHADSDEIQSLHEAMKSAPVSLRREVFWSHDALMLRRFPAKEQEPRSRLFRFHHHQPFSPDLLADETWIKSDLQDQSRPLTQRAVALELLVMLVVNAHDAEAAIGHLAEYLPLVADSPALTGSLATEIEKVRQPAEEPSWARRSREHQETQRRKHAKDYASWCGLFRELRNDPTLVNSEERQANIAYNLWRAMRRLASSTGEPGWNRGFLERVFDEQTAGRVREALMARWRSLEPAPSLKCEREPEQRNLYWDVWGMGIAGLYAEAEKPGWAARLSSEEVERAVRFAMVSNGLPPWLDTLAQVHPATVLAIVTKELEGELGSPTKPANYSMLLQSMEHSGSEWIGGAIDQLKAWIVEVLAGEDPSYAHAAVLKQAIQVVLRHCSPAERAWLEGLAEKHLVSSSSQDSILFWLRMLSQLNISLTVSKLEALAADLDPANHGAATEWIAELFGDRHTGEAIYWEELKSSPSLLLRLTLLAYRYVRVADDVLREGCFSPGPRDTAERARSILCNALLSAKGIDAWEAKRKLAADGLMDHLRDRAVALANEAMAEEIDSPQLGQEALIALEKRNDFAPRIRADMAALLASRLDDLDDFILQDESSRQLWSTTNVEALMRRELSRFFRDREYGAYVVIQEAVTAEEKETDIRLRSTASNQEAVIELKIGENYSVRELEAALRTQLVERYLAPENRRAGCLLFTVRRDKHWVDPERGSSLTAQQVVEYLRAIADKLVVESGYQMYLTVRALNLVSRLH